MNQQNTINVALLATEFLHLTKTMFNLKYY